MKMKHLFPGGAIVVLISALLCLRPVPIISEEKCVVLKAVVADVYEDGSNDVVLKLQGRNETFYVNRGLERGLNLNTLRADLVGREITIKYPDFWTVLDPGKTNLHLSKIELEGATIFTEFEEADRNIK